MDDLRATLDRLGDAHRDAVTALAADVREAWRGGGRFLVCGNGGSAADAQHIAAELVGRFQAERPGYASIALTTNTSTLTAVANDYGLRPHLRPPGAGPGPARRRAAGAVHQRQLAQLRRGGGRRPRARA